MSGTDIPQTEIKKIKGSPSSGTSLYFTITLLLTTKLTVNLSFANSVPKPLIYLLNLNVLYLITRIIVIHKDCHKEDFPTCVEMPQCIFHV